LLGKIIVHGGAGFWRQDLRTGISGVTSAASAGADILKHGGPALDAVERAVTVMEDDPIFNAGKGSSLTVIGTVEMDASIMDGRDLSAGAVALLHTTKNPIQLARIVMEKTDHILLAGKNAERLATAFSLPKRNPITQRRQRLLNVLRSGSRRVEWLHENSVLLREHPELAPHDTVGAVAVDREGNFAAASSTGGIMMKLPGRIGDTPQIGSGVYADNRSGAATATGIGEVAIRLAISRTVCLFMEQGRPAYAAASAAIKTASERLHGEAGIIAIDRQRGLAAVHNTPYMPWAFSTTRMRRVEAKPWGKRVAPSRPPS
jgi:beta-aspartyl-peptidase (threonine type)